MERRFHDWKGPLQVRPVFVTSPKRIAAFLLLLHLALRLCCLLDREARRALAQRGADEAPPPAGGPRRGRAHRGESPGRLRTPLAREGRGASGELGHDGTDPGAAATLDPAQPAGPADGVISSRPPGSTRHASTPSPNRKKGAYVTLVGLRAKRRSEAVTAPDRFEVPMQEIRVRSRLGYWTFRAK